MTKYSQKPILSTYKSVTNLLHQSRRDIEDSAKIFGIEGTKMHDTGM